MTVRVRFAPSPTGHLHLGNARSAIVNALFAARHNGWMLLRFDDTDLERSQPEYIQSIYDDLAWLGIKYDEVAHQSQRFERYKEVMKEWVDTGRLYPCYETPEELNFKRKRQLAAHKPPIYDRAALSLTDEDRSNYEKQGIKPHWRFRLNPQVMMWSDCVKGDLRYDAASLSDPVLVRADGAFLYTFTSVVDDVDFSITHILRGEDHVTNTAVQLQLFEAMNASKPEFGHTSLLLDHDGKPLSKRLGSLSLNALRDSGMEASSLISLVARLGTSKAYEPFLSIEEAGSAFNLSDFGQASPRFDEKDLWSLNHKVLSRFTFESIKNRLPVGATEVLWNLVSPHLNKLSDIESWINLPEASLSTEDKEYVMNASDCLPTVWNESTWGTWTGQLKEKTGRSGKKLFKPLRLAVTGHEHGPEMALWLQYAGYEKVRERLTKAAS